MTFDYNINAQVEGLLCPSIQYRRELRGKLESHSFFSVQFSSFCDQIRWHLSLSESTPVFAARR